jgi:demethylmenaquinone methyltransferase/2-methoxy-6-polyprenyl-1,4-benzoquinol methylase
MFDRISRRYDLMNRLMTGGRDVAWRRLAAREALAGGRSCVLDVASGTGDLAIELARQGAARVVALDFSREMLRGAAEKLRRLGRPRIELVCADAMCLPFPDATFDACTIGFGLRNLPDYQSGIAEMTRVLRPGGRVIILETTPVRQRWLALPFRLYFDRIVPLLGGLISGDRDAYGYLPRSTGAFPDAETLAAMLAGAGLTQVRFRRLMLGTVALHVAVRPAVAWAAASRPERERTYQQ